MSLPMEYQISKSCLYGITLRVNHLTDVRYQYDSRQLKDGDIINIDVTVSERIGECTSVRSGDSNVTVFRSTLMGTMETRQGRFWWAMLMSKVVH